MDISDATMAYFLVTGDEHATLTKLQNLLEHRIRPQPFNPRATLRMEAGELCHLAALHGGLRGPSGVQAPQGARGPKRHRPDSGTAFKELYTVPAARYDVAVRYYDASGGHSTFQLKVRGQRWRQLGGERREQHLEDPDPHRRGHPPGRCRRSGGQDRRHRTGPAGLRRPDLPGRGVTPRGAAAGKIEKGVRMRHLPPPTTRAACKQMPQPARGPTRGTPLGLWPALVHRQPESPALRRGLLHPAAGPPPAGAAGAPAAVAAAPGWASRSCWPSGRVPDWRPRSQ